MRIERLICGDYQTNCYILIADKSTEAVVIDPGDDPEAIEDALTRLGVRAGAILLTHGHFDHFLGAASLKKRDGAKVFVSRADENALSDETASVLPADARTPFTPMRADGFLDEGVFSVCGLNFTVIPTPGHTPGGVCLLSEDQNDLFTGDTLFERGFGRTDFPGGSWSALVQSLRSLFKLACDPTVHPGHGESARLTDIRKGYYR